jgi:hypothetical protein
MASDLEVARAARTWLDSPPVNDRTLTASMTGRLHEALVDAQPIALYRFGIATLRAASRSVPAGCCRWGAADRDARVHGTTRPRLDQATRELVGRPCKRCVMRLRAELKTRVDSGRGSMAVPAAGTVGRRAQDPPKMAGRGAPPSRYGVTASASGVCCETFRATGDKHWTGCVTRRRR